MLPRYESAKLAGKSASWKNFTGQDGFIVSESMIISSRLPLLLDLLAQDEFCLSVRGKFSSRIIEWRYCSTFLLYVLA